MRHNRSTLLLLAAAVSLFAAAPAVLAAPDAAPSPLPAPAPAPDRGEVVDAITVPSAIVARNVPPIPQSAVEPLRPYQNSRGAALLEWHPRERAILIATRFAETNQLHEVAMPMGARTQITFEAERVSGGSYRPGRPEQIGFARDEGGAENFQLFLLDRTTGRSHRFTDGKHRFLGAQWSRDGSRIAYAGNARNGRDMDVYLWQPEAGGQGRLLAELKGNWSPLDWSYDNRRLLVSEGISVHESYLHSIDVATGAVTALTPRRGDQPVAYDGGKWTPDGRAVYATTDRGSEFHHLVRLDVATGEHQVLSADVPWDVESFDLSEDGKLLAFMTNEEGRSKLHLLDVATGKRLPAPELPPGTAGNLEFRPGGHELGFRMSWARSPSDLYSYDPATAKLERWTASEVGGLDPSRFVVPELVRFPTFDETAPGVKRTIPAWVYKAPADRFPAPRPVVINIHGGPEGQSRPGFLGATNYLTSELGVTIIYPNVRGSTGYGKTFGRLDNGMLREDSVKDIGALLDWVQTQPDLDAARVMVAGGSYGGYMVLASLVHYSDRLRCAHETVGISDFRTFLENTQEYRRDLRRVEYGDERDPAMRAYFERISPRRQASKMRVPLLVAQGANDPRVPVSESDEIVKAIESTGTPVWYVVGTNEGHGFAKKPNVDYLQAVLYEFIERHLLAPRVSAPAQPGS